MTRKILALDISKKATAWAVGNAGEKPVVGVVSFNKYGRDTKAVDDDVWWAAFLWAKDLMQTHRPDVAYIEAPMQRVGTDEAGRQVSSAKTILTLWAMQTAIRLPIRAILGSPAVIVWPSTARKSFTGRGTYPEGQAKDVVRAHAIRLGWLTEENATEDKADACCVFGHGCILYDKALASIIRPDWAA